VISIAIGSLILSLTVRSIVAKRRQELGILKSSGYTTNQLVKQMTISFLPMTTLGIALGCVGGAVLFSPMLGAAMTGMGALNYSAVINPFIVAVIGVAVFAITCLVAHISAMSIKKITVYELLSE
jgi:putative ABC transport system permease protein